jgi:GNAT superfamily N-acetyltransferase
MVKTETLITTYLEMRAEPVASQDQKSEISDQKLNVEELKEPNWKFNREMYFKVGEQWRWIDKRPWTEERWKEYASDPSLRTFAGYTDDKLVGYYELHRDPKSGVEIAYFGLLADFVGRGLGRALLTSAIENAWAWAPRPSRVWVHTCNRDHPHALANYQSRGFEIYKIEREGPPSDAVRRISSDMA